mmetsp:Transcript_12062/g.30549  ORF Transcript_12062/g.30549 Transcript_12062/m.30549 type:complete len:261 (+) Transcript_12062:240-1022(+)
MTRRSTKRKRPSRRRRRRRRAPAPRPSVQHIRWHRRRPRLRYARRPARMWTVLPRWSPVHRIGDRSGPRRELRRCEAPLDWPTPTCWSTAAATCRRRCRAPSRPNCCPRRSWPRCAPRASSGRPSAPNISASCTRSSCARWWCERRERPPVWIRSWCTSSAAMRWWCACTATSRCERPPQRHWSSCASSNSLVPSRCTRIRCACVPTTARTSCAGPATRPHSGTARCWRYGCPAWAALRWRCAPPTRSGAPTPLSRCCSP